MIKKTITYEDFDGNVQEKECWFHLSKSEMMMMNLEYKGIIKTIESLQKENDQAAMAKFVDDFMVSAYGERTADNQSFMKTPEIRETFRYSAAHDEMLMMLLAGDDEEIVDFILGVMPGGSPEIRQQILAEINKKTAETKALEASPAE